MNPEVLALLAAWDEAASFGADPEAPAIDWRLYDEDPGYREHADDLLAEAAVDADRLAAWAAHSPGDLAWVGIDPGAIAVP